MTADFEVPTIIPAGNEMYLNKNSDYIFDQGSLHTFDLKIPTKSLSKLDNNPKAEEYVEGMLIFQGDTISPVGIRYKGAVGAFFGCLSKYQSGYKTCTKLSMKVKINWNGRDEKFFKLKRLQFHSMNNEPSQMNERLVHQIISSFSNFSLFPIFDLLKFLTVTTAMLYHPTASGSFTLQDHSFVPFKKEKHP